MNAADQDNGIGPAGSGRWKAPVRTAVLALIAALMLYVAAPNIGSTTRAARGEGVPGVFTSRRLDCVRHGGHLTCTSAGDFRSSDGRIRRTYVTMCGGRSDTLQPGSRAAAIDVGREDRVYAPGGCSGELVLTLSLSLMGLGILTTLTARRLRRLPAARRRVAPPAA